MSEQAPFQSVTFARDFLAYIQSRIEHADAKLQLVLAADTVLVALVTTPASELMKQAFVRGASPLEFVGGAVTVLLLLSVGCSILFAFLTLRPRLAPGPRQSLFFFGNIANKTAEQFIEEFAGLSEGEAIEDLLCQVHVNSQIANAKFRLIAVSTNAFIAALVLWIVSLVLSALA